MLTSNCGVVFLGLRSEYKWHYGIVCKSVWPNWYVSLSSSNLLMSTKINNMIYTLKCNNGKEIDMTSYIVQQMENKITRKDVLDRIEFYKSTNK